MTGVAFIHSVDSAALRRDFSHNYGSATIPSAPTNLDMGVIAPATDQTIYCS